jgi:hypothetical protein
MNLKALCPFALLVCLAAGPSMAQTEAMCAGLAEAATWPMDHDAVKAAPKNHKVIYESADVRVLEVTVQPGERELVHHHQWPSVMVVDSRPKYVNYDKDGKEIRPAVQAPPNPEMPIMVRLPAQAEHAIDNVGDKPFHAIRIEYKKLCPAP